MGMNNRDPYKLFPHDQIFRYTLVPLTPKYVTPNIVTVLRLLSIPFILWLLYVENYAVGVPLFIASAISDAFDGSLARLRRQVTDWGTFYDPVADKLLIGSVVILVVIQQISLIFALVIVGIEVLIILGGWYGRRKGELRSANIFGKTKMVLQVIGVSMLLVAMWAGFAPFFISSIVVLSAATVFALISLFTYGL